MEGDITIGSTGHRTKPYGTFFPLVVICERHRLEFLQGPQEKSHMGNVRN